MYQLQVSVPLTFRPAVDSGIGRNHSLRLGVRQYDLVLDWLYNYGSIWFCKLKFGETGGEECSSFSEGKFAYSYSDAVCKHTIGMPRTV